VVERDREAVGGGADELVLVRSQRDRAAALAVTALAEPKWAPWIEPEFPFFSSSLDLRIGCERTQFRFLAASYGRVNSTWSLPALVGIPKAKELLYTGRVVAAEEAERIGLLNQIVPAAKLLESAIEIGQMIAKNDPRMVQGIKRLLHEGMGLDLQGRYDLEDEARATYLSAGHPRDGFKDFLARKPVRA